MRTLGEIPHPKCKIQLMAWNGKFLIRFEQGPCEQIYKIDQFEVASEAEVRAKITEAFIDRVVERFAEMHVDRETFCE